MGSEDVDECLVCWMVSTQGQDQNGQERTFQQGLDLRQLSSIIELSEVLGLLRNLLPLHQCIFLVIDDLRRSCVKLRDQIRQIDT